MPNLLLDDTITRVEMPGFAFPLGVYPTESCEPRPGYVVEFEPADGGGDFVETTSPGPEEAWEEWPDRFMFDVLIGAPRVQSLCTMLFSLLPLRAYPILDVFGRDEYREIDPFIAYDLVGLDRFLEGLGMFGSWLFEDGMVGFGAMSLEPFLYIFVDEHKIVTVRAEITLKEQIERILGSFDLRELAMINGADSVEHEHRTVLADPLNQKEALRIDEIIDVLRESWQLQLNVDPATNIDDEGRELGVTWWDCIARCIPDSEDTQRHAEVLLAAGGIDEAEQLVTDALMSEVSGTSGLADIYLVRSDRVSNASMQELSEGAAGESDPEEPKVVRIRFLD